MMPLQITVATLKYDHIIYTNPDLAANENKFTFSPFIWDIMPVLFWGGGEQVDL